MSTVDDHRSETPAPDGYRELLDQLTARVRQTQLRAVRSANTEVLTLYWSIGRDIVDRQHLAGWGARIVDRLDADLRAAFPDQRGWSRRNLQYMRAFAGAWPSWAILPTAVGQLPWGHVRALLDRLDAVVERASLPSRPAPGPVGRPPAAAAGPGRCAAGSGS